MLKSPQEIKAMRSTYRELRAIFRRKGRIKTHTPLHDLMVALKYIDKLEGRKPVKRLIKSRRHDNGE